MAQFAAGIVGLASVAYGSLYAINAYRFPTIEKPTVTVDGHTATVKFNNSHVRNVRVPSLTGHIDSKVRRTDGTIAMTFPDVSSDAIKEAVCDRPLFVEYWLANGAGRATVSHTIV